MEINLPPYIKLIVYAVLATNGLKITVQLGCFFLNR
jgi:hypothetical protein